MTPKPQRDGWSEPIYFFDDRIDLDAFFNIDVGARTVAYAFTWVDAQRDQEAELWIGSDEAMRVWVNEIVKEKVRIPLQRGENRVLVKAVQVFSDFQFALNICEPESDPDIDGDRVAGLAFRGLPMSMTAVDDAPGTPAAFALAPSYPNPFNASTVIPFQIDQTAGQAPVVTLEIIDTAGQRLRTLVHRAMSPGRDDAGRAVASGLFFARLHVEGGSVASGKLVLLR
jgi:hypothetical protein